jgi:hypothetical protein
MVNAKGEAVYVKFHAKTAQGIKNMDVKRADETSGSDPDYSIRDLYNSIAKGEFPSWNFFIQVMSFDEAERHKWNPFDVTKVWPQTEFPLIPVGRLVLDRNPNNYFAEVEQIAFCPSHLVPGIESSPDKMLQGRLFSYTGFFLNLLRLCISLRSFFFIKILIVIAWVQTTCKFRLTVHTVSALRIINAMDLHATTIIKVVHRTTIQTALEALNQLNAQSIFKDHILSLVKFTVTTAEMRTISANPLSSGQKFWTTLLANVLFLTLLDTSLMQRSLSKSEPSIISLKFQPILDNS